MGSPVISKCLPSQPRPLSSFQFFGKNSVAFWRRVKRVQQFQAFPQVAAGHLARAGFHVDIAADSVQIECRRVFERLRGVFAKELGLRADIGLVKEVRRF
jgi:hypothetical protein